jgi:hypothetical protein
MSFMSAILGRLISIYAKETIFENDTSEFLFAGASALRRAAIRRRPA